MPDVVIINDTSTTGHFGGRQLMANLIEGLESRGCNVLGTVKTTDDWKNNIGLLDKADLVIVNGEGSIHHGRRMDLLDVSLKYPSVLINTVYHAVPDNVSIYQFKYVSVRESLSAKEMPIKVKIVPDLFFLNNIERPEINEPMTVQQPDCKNPDFIKFVGAHEAVATHSFHTICLAIMWGMRYQVIHTTNTHKVKGLIRDVGHSPSKYISKARKSINKMLDSVVALCPA